MDDGGDDHYYGRLIIIKKSTVMITEPISSTNDNVSDSFLFGKFLSYYFKYTLSFGLQIFSGSRFF